MTRGKSTEWQIVAPVEPKSYPAFVNEDTLFVSSPTRRILIRTDGKVLLEEPNEPRLGWGSGCSGTRVVPSVQGRRFAIPGCQEKGAVATLDIGGHTVLREVFVYDIGTTVKLTAIQLKGQKIQDQMQFAISPDGLNLAILNNEFVEIYKLPPAH